MTKKRLFSVTIVALLVSLMIYSCKKKDEPIVYKNPEITWANPANITEGTLLSATQLNATANVAGTFVYTPAIGTKLDVGYYQDLKVDFTPTTVDYYFATKAVKINVIPSFKPTNGLTTAVFNNTKTYGTMTDQDGNVYKTITIGTQTWMAENLRTTKYRDGTAIPNVTDNTAWFALTTGAYCTYNNTTKLDSIATFGRLYNWYAVNTKNLSPKGWHVPTKAEWSTLRSFVDGDYKLIESGTTHWQYNSASTNETGFTALPGGNRLGISASMSGQFLGLGYGGNFWTSSLAGTDGFSSSGYSTSFTYYSISEWATDLVEGFSVRCVKD